MRSQASAEPGGSVGPDDAAARGEKRGLQDAGTATDSEAARASPPRGERGGSEARARPRPRASRRIVGLCRAARAASRGLCGSPSASPMAAAATAVSSSDGDDRRRSDASKRTPPRRARRPQDRGNRGSGSPREPAARPCSAVPRRPSLRRRAGSPPPESPPSGRRSSAGAEERGSWSPFSVTCPREIPPAGGRPGRLQSRRVRKLLRLIAALVALALALVLLWPLRRSPHDRVRDGDRPVPRGPDRDRSPRRPHDPRLVRCRRPVRPGLRPRAGSTLADGVPATGRSRPPRRDPGAAAGRLGPLPAHGRIPTRGAGKSRRRFLRRFESCSTPTSAGSMPSGRSRAPPSSSAFCGSDPSHSTPPTPRLGEADGLGPRGKRRGGDPTLAPRGRGRPGSGRRALPRVPGSPTILLDGEWPSEGPAPRLPPERTPSFTGIPGRLEASSSGSRVWARGVTRSEATPGSWRDPGRRRAGRSSPTIRTWAASPVGLVPGATGGSRTLGRRSDAPRPSGDRHRPQRPDRVGPDEPRAGRAGPLRRDDGPRGSGPLPPSGRVEAPSRRAARRSASAAERTCRSRSAPRSTARSSPTFSTARRRSSAPVALRWTGLDPGDRTAEALGRHQPGGRAGRTFSRHWRWSTRPPQNFVYADVEGHIGYAAAGPRSDPPAGGGERPVSGEGADDWSGFFPFESFPASSTRRAATSSPPTTGSCRSDSRTRSAATGRSLTGRDASRSCCWRGAASASPTCAGSSSTAFPGRPRTFFPCCCGPGPATRRLPRRSHGSGGGTATWRPIPCRRNLRGLVLGARAYARGRARRDAFREDPIPIPHQRAARRSAWCDDARTRERESCGDFQAATLRDAVALLSGRLGPDPSGWRWDRLHRARFPHAVLTASPSFAGSRVSRPARGAMPRRSTSARMPWMAPSTCATGRATGRSWTSRIRRDRSTSTRRGSPAIRLERGYRDLLPLWRRGEFFRISREGSAPRVLELRPSGTSRAGGAPAPGWRLERGGSRRLRGPFVDPVVADLAVQEADDPPGVGGDVLLVRDEDDRVAAASSARRRAP